MPKTVAKKTAALKKWTCFCETLLVTSDERLPHEHTALRFLSYLAGPDANVFGGFLSYDTVDAYFQEVRSQFELWHNQKLESVFGRRW